MISLNDKKNKFDLKIRKKRLNDAIKNFRQNYI